MMGTAIKLLWYGLQWWLGYRTITIQIYGRPTSGRTWFYCGIPDDAVIYDDNAEWQQIHDRIFNTSKRESLHD